MEAKELNDVKELVSAELKKISDQVKEAGEKALAEAKKGIDMSGATKEKVDEMLVKQGELQARLLEVEQKQVRSLGGGEDDEQPKTVGHQLIDDPEFKAWLEKGGMKSLQAGFVYQVKAVLSSGTTNITTVGVPADLQSGVFQGAERRLTIRDLITPGTTSSNLVQYVKETGFTNNAATVSEANLKPESTITYALTQSPVVTIAHFVKASKQILDDFQQLQSMIDGRMNYGLKLVEETQLLKGSGVGHNLNGIYTQATTYVAPFSPPSPSKIDELRLMILQSELAEYPATGIVLNPIDWAAIELKKDTTGRYIIGNPQGTIRPTLWGRPVVATQAMTVDTALVGAFMLGAQVFDREQANIVIATQNEDDFVKNMITIRNEERLALAVYRPEAFIKSTNMSGS